MTNKSELLLLGVDGMIYGIQGRGFKILFEVEYIELWAMIESLFARFLGPSLLHFNPPRMELYEVSNATRKLLRICCTKSITITVFC